MQPSLAPIRRLLFLWSGLLTLANSDATSAPFGMLDPDFASPSFTGRAYPGNCTADGRGGLLWSFENVWVGSLSGTKSVRLGGLVRTTIDGELDTNFVVGPNLQDTMGVAVQTDGKILVGGRLLGDLAVNGCRNYRVFRYFTNGVRDNSYQSPVFSSPPRFMTLQADGRLLAAFTEDSAVTAANGGITGLARLNVDGSLDTGFQRPHLGGSTYNYGVFAPPVVDGEGKIYIAGGFTLVNGQNRQGVARLHPDGTLDDTFVSDSHRFSMFVRSVLLQPGGKVVIAGRLRPSSDTMFTYYPLLRLDADGSVDSSFILVPCAALDFYRARLLRATPEGKILTVSTSMARFNSDGSVDDTFTRLRFGDPQGVPAPYVECYWFEQLADGKLVIPGDPRWGSGPSTVGGQPFNGSIRLLVDGGLDPAYRQPEFENLQFPLLVKRHESGRWLVGGAFDRVGDTQRQGLARLDPDGTPDSTFRSAVSNLLSVWSLAPLPGDKCYALLQTGDWYSGVISNNLLRLNADGSLDPDFQPSDGGFKANNSGYADLLLQGDKPLVAGPDAQAVVSGSVPLVRFHTNGIVDAGFSPKLSVPGLVIREPEGFINNIIVGDVHLLAVLPDGKLLVNETVEPYPVSGGSFFYRLFRLNPDGGLDNGFLGTVLAAPVSKSSYYAVVFDPQSGSEASAPTVEVVRVVDGATPLADGKTLIYGSFTNLNGVAKPGIARLSGDGSLDSGFPVGSGPVCGQSPLAPVRICSVSLDSKGRTWVSGNFTQWDGVAAPGYVRLNADGGVDTSCQVESRHVEMERDQNSPFNGATPNERDACLLFGAHLAPGEIWPRALSRLTEYLPPPLQPEGILSGFGFRMSVQTLPGAAYRLQVSTDLKDWQDWFGFQGNGETMSITDPAALHSPKKYYRVGFQQ